MPGPQSPAKLDLGKSNGLYDTASVREKVRKWHTTGGGVLEQQDEVAAVASGEDDKQSKSDKKSAASSAKSRSRAASSHAKSHSEGNIHIADDAPKTPSQLSRADKQPTAPSTEPTKPRIVERRPQLNHLDTDVIDATAPKKRIVSDGHWRRKHIDPDAKPPSPPKALPKKKEQFAWTRPPLLPRLGSDELDDEPLSSPKAKGEPRPVRVYTGKLISKPIATQIHSQLSKRPANSVPIPEPISAPVTPRVRRQSIAKPPVSYHSEPESPPKPSRTTQKRRSSVVKPRALEDEYHSPDERPRRRLTKSRATTTDEDRAEKPVRRRSLSVGNELGGPQHRGSIRNASAQHESDLERNYGPRRSRRVSHESSSSSETARSQSSPPKELNNYDENAEKRRSTFRAEFTPYTPPKEPRSSRRKRGPTRFSYSPDGIDRLQQPTQKDVVPEPQPPQRQTSHRIEAWLTETPDPFKEPTDERKKARPRRDFSFETHSELTMTESTIETGTTITDSTMEPRKSTRPRKVSSRSAATATRHIRAQSEPSDSLDPDIEIEYSSTTSVPILNRNGPRHSTVSPTGRPKPKSTRTVSSYTESYTESDVTSSVVSSSIDPRGFEKPGEDGKPLNAARRLFPSTGKRLSTIVSVETLATRDLERSRKEAGGGVDNDRLTIAKRDQDGSRSEVSDATELPDHPGGSVVSVARSRTSVKKRTASHADLMTVLSMPASRSKSIVSARSIRTHKSRLDSATVEDLMRELASDEAKYMRELRTLADGVIPILLKCVLSKSDAAVAAGLFKSSPQSEKEAVAEASKVIHDLSVAIQRLKSLHTRIPKENHFSLLIWAQSAHSVYEKFIKTWRLGFQDVVVSLAPETDGSRVSTAPSSTSNAWDKGLPLNEDGYVVNGDGERVDVAFLLKRPLVRLKFLAKTMKGINVKKPSEQAGVLARKFEKLMDLARNKVSDEKARVEDEAAALIDATRVRDPKSLAPLSGVKIDPHRCVRARDYFDMHLPHSSGQIMDCRVELLVRDDAPGRGNSGDVLICEVDEEDRWLLFPPMEFKRISARPGDEPGEIVAMIRGVSSSGEQWDEIFRLLTDDEEIRFEWIQWLGLTPVPPSLNRVRTFKPPAPRPASSHASSSLSSRSAHTESTTPFKSRTPSPREIEIPIGERIGSASKRWTRDIVSSKIAGSDTSSALSSVDSEYADMRSPVFRQIDNDSHVASSILTESDISANGTPLPREQEQAYSASRHATPRNLNEAMAMAGAGSPSLKRAQAKRYRSSPEKLMEKNRLQGDSNVASAKPEKPDERLAQPIKRKSIKKTRPNGDFSVWIPSSEMADSDSGSDDEEDDSIASSYLSGSHLHSHHRTSSVPAMNLPTMPRLRSSKRDDEYMSGALLPELPETPTKKDLEPREALSAPSKLQLKPQKLSQSAPSSHTVDKPPKPPPHRTPSSSQVKFAPTPQFAPASQIKRRSSSPLKHEYRPSSPSSDSSYTEDSISDSSDGSLTSESEDEIDELDDDDASTFISSVAPKEPQKSPDMYSLPNGTIKPSESASQAPYRAVPQAIASEIKPSKCVATIFAWSDKGQWELLHPEDCSIVITPGLIGAYVMTENHKTEELPEERPLVAQELTPLVQLRRGTALDITIRSMPTAASRLRPGANIMFRSRSSEECEVLYHFLNRSRINNPTYIALQNARPAPAGDGWAAAIDRQNSMRGNDPSTRWFGLARSKSYRASSRAQSTAGNTESSIGTISSVITAMKRFSNASGFMNGARSARLSMSRDGSDSLGSSGSGTRSPPHFVATQHLTAGAGISNAKVRLYVLQSQNNKWLDLGSSRLSILPKEEGAMIAAPSMLHNGLEKRIRVAKKRKGWGGDKADGDILLDVTLPENCFERWARTGIGVSVWVDVVGGDAGGIAPTGGVSDKRVVKYMIQLKSERECAYTFSLLGKLRY